MYWSKLEGPVTAPVDLCFHVSSRNNGENTGYYGVDTTKSYFLQDTLVFCPNPACLLQYPIKPRILTRFSGVDFLSGCPYTDPAFTPRQDRATQRCDLSGCGGLARERLCRSFSFAWFRFCKLLANRSHGKQKR